MSISKNESILIMYGLAAGAEYQLSAEFEKKVLRSIGLVRRAQPTGTQLKLAIKTKRCNLAVKGYVTFRDGMQVGSSRILAPTRLLHCVVLGIRRLQLRASSLKRICDRQLKPRLARPRKKSYFAVTLFSWRARPDSNRRSPPWQGGMLGLYTTSPYKDRGNFSKSEVFLQGWTIC